MKKFNLKLITPLILTFILQGCLPDSLTKFKKDPPKKSTAAATTTTGGGTPGGPIVDPTTGTVFVPTLPSYFYYLSAATQDKALELGVAASIPPSWDGTLADTTKASLLSPTCEAFDITTGTPVALTTATVRTITPGITLGRTSCVISGTPTSLSSNGTTGNEGKPLNYKIVLSYLSANGLSVLTKTAYINIGVYVKPTSLSYVQNDKLILKGNPAFGVDLTKLQGSIDKTIDYIPTTNLLTSITGIQSVINYADPLSNQIGITKVFSLYVDQVTPLAINKFVDDQGNLQDQIIDKVIGVDDVTVFNVNDYIVSNGFARAQIIEKFKPSAVSTAGTLRIRMKDVNQNFTIGSKLDKDLSGSYSGVYATQLAQITASGGISKIIGKIVYIDTSTSSNIVNIERLAPQSKVNQLTSLYKVLDHTSVANTSVVYLLLRVTNVNNFVFNGNILSKDGLKSGIVKDFDIANNILLVQMSSLLYFTVGDSVDTSFVTPSAYPSYVTQTNIPPTINLQSGNKLDTNGQFYSTKYNVLDIIRTYPVDVNNDIEPIIPSADNYINSYNNITFYISPQLPAGLSFNSKTGAITGRFLTSLDSTLFNVYAVVNGLNTAANTTAVAYVNLAAIDTPKDLILTNKQIITVTDNSKFTEGEDLYKSFVSPDTENLHGKVLRKIGTTKLAIAIYNGPFLKGASLDSGSAFFSEKATITNINPVYYNIALSLNDVSSYAVGDYVNSTAGLGIGATGRVADIDLVNKTLYVQFATPAPSAIVTFAQGDTVKPGVTITQVESENLKLGLTTITAATFLAGTDITSTTNSGYIYTNDSSSGTVLSVSYMSRTDVNGFRVGDAITNAEKFGVSDATIASITHDNFYTVERNVRTIINAVVSSGAGISYSISPALPTGLAINSSTGVISGTPSVLTPRKNYLITAINNLGISQFAFALEVSDFFSLADLSNAPSFILHKVGQNQNGRKCRINANDILSNNGAALDIRCNLEGQEEDVHFNPIKLQAMVGPGICQYIQYAPYYFWQYSPVQTDPTITYATVRTGCANDPTPTADVCAGNYSAYGALGPNCDEGKVKYLVQPTTDSGGGVCANSGAATVQYVQCGGKKVSCMAGPVKDLLTDAKLTTGFRSLIYQTPNGASLNWLYSAPIDKGDLTNIRVSNSTVNNKCTSSNSDVNTWTTKAATTANTTNPFGQSSPYYIFNCLDAANQIKARIRVTIRDWDRNFKINYGIDLDNPSLAVAPQIASDVVNAITTPFMNVTGADTYGNPWNNHADWDNDFTNLGSCSIGAITSEYYCNANGGTWTSGGANYAGACGVKGAGTDYAYPGLSL